MLLCYWYNCNSLGLIHKSPIHFFLSLLLQTPCGRFARFDVSSTRVSRHDALPPKFKPSDSSTPRRASVSLRRGPRCWCVCASSAPARQHSPDSTREPRRPFPPSSSGRRDIRGRPRRQAFSRAHRRPQGACRWRRGPAGGSELGE